MAKKMLIDATHPEETRVVVADGNKVEEFDFENLNKRQLAGNIYLAKVTRVEPSLQAAFIDYGGNRHGFLAFAEIHPDYYQIPKADRDAILAEERALAAEQAEADEAADTKAAAAREARGGLDDGEGEMSDDAPDAASGTQDDAATADASRDDAGRKGRSRSRSRSRSRRKSDDGAPEGPAAGDDSPSASDELSDEARERDHVVSGTAAEVSEAATETIGQGSDAASDAAPDAASDAAARGDADSDAGSGEGSGEDLEDGGTVRTIAEDTGLEDETVSADPSGMETVDVEDEDEDAGDPVEEPTPRRTSRARSRKKAVDKDDSVETVGEEDEPEDMRPARTPRPKARKYKIQEVVKVRQIMLVQVVKEERGNKGAALTTYLSLAGRYCVLMPNTARGGGISRKITNAVDRKKLKEIAEEIDVPQGAGLIVRTAGAKRTKTEIKRDYEYLQRMWEQVRELTLKSIAPAPIYEEGNLIHRSIRDLYHRDIDEVIVEGEAGYRDARDYMKLIMPSHAKNVKPHPLDGQPLFAKHGVESYLASMFSPTVQLKSGGYIVIGITEALVAIDVNSGKSTKEGSIEDTATKTNLEAADEVARQMRLRDLAGLIVIDFIDMDERRNNAAVEKRLKEALKHDRARLQVGRISGFGLLEMSRQRLRPGMLEATTQACPHCHGTGLIRSDDSVALQILRALEEEGVKKRSKEVKLCVPVEVCNYLMNEKREHLAAIEGRYDMAVRVVADPQIIAPDYLIEKFKTATRVIPKLAIVVQTDTSWTSDDDEAIEAEADEVDAEERAEDEAPEAPETPQEARDDARSGSNDRQADDGDGQSRKKRRRRSRRKKPGGGDENGQSAETRSSEDEPGERRSGRRQSEEIQPDDGRSADAGGDAGPDDSAGAADVAAAVIEDGAVGTARASETDAAAVEPAPKSRSRTRSRSKKVEAPEETAASVDEALAQAVTEPDAGSDVGAEAEPEVEAEKPKRRSRARAKAPATGASEELTAAAEVAEAAQAEAPAPQVEAPEGEAPEGGSPDAEAPEAEAPQEQPGQESAVQTEAPVVQTAEAQDAPATEPDATAKPKRKGWWSFGS